MLAFIVPLCVQVVSKLPVRLTVLPNEVSVFRWLLTTVGCIPVPSPSLCKLVFMQIGTLGDFLVPSHVCCLHLLHPKSQNECLLFAGFLFLPQYLPKHSSSSWPSPCQIPPIQGTQHFSFLWNLDSQGFMLHRLVEAFPWSPDWVSFHSLHWPVPPPPAALPGLALPPLSVFH